MYSVLTFNAEKHMWYSSRILSFIVLRKWTEHCRNSFIKQLLGWRNFRSCSECFASVVTLRDITYVNSWVSGEHRKPQDGTNFCWKTSFTGEFYVAGLWLWVHCILQYTPYPPTPPSSISLHPCDSGHRTKSSKFVNFPKSTDEKGRGNCPMIESILNFWQMAQNCKLKQ